MMEMDESEASGSGGEDKDHGPLTVDIQDEEDDDEAYSTARTEDGSNLGSEGETTPRSVSRRKKRGRKGKDELDLSPPDKKLQRSQKLAKKFTESKKYDEAIKELIKAVAYSRIIHGDGHWKLASAYVDLAQGYFELKDYPVQAQAHAETAKNIMFNGMHTTSSDVDKSNIFGVSIRIQYILGISLIALQRFNEAEHCLLRAEKQNKEQAKLSASDLDEVDDMDIKIRTALAKVNAKQQKFAVAIRYLEKVLELIKLARGEDSLELIPIYQGIGQVEQAKGKLANHERAVEMYLQAHAIVSAHYKDGAVEIAETARALASAYAQTGDPAGETSAESYMNEALITYQVVYGPNHEKTIDTQDEIAKLMVRTDRHGEAISLLKSTITSKKEVYGDNSEEVADTYKLIASVQLAQGQMENALKSFQKCLAIEEMLYGAGHKKTKNTQSSIDMILANPRVKSSQPKSKKEELSSRPRFSSIVNRSSQVGGFKT